MPNNITVMGKKMYVGYCENMIWFVISLYNKVRVFTHVYGGAVP